MIALLKKGLLALIGAFTAAMIDAVENVWIYLFLASAFVIIDCITAYKLNRRLKKKYGPNIVQGKYTSHGFWKTLETLGKSCAAIFLGYFIYKYMLIPEGGSAMLHIYATGAVIGIQSWSILENSSSCNGSKWAALAQKIVIDKSKRHLHIDLKPLKNDKNE